MTTFKATVLALGALCAMQKSAYAIDVDAGDYAVAPGGTNLFLLYAQHAKRNSSYSGGTQNPGSPGLKSDIGILRGVRYVDLGDVIVAPQVLLPFGSLSASGSISALGSNTGVGDIILGLQHYMGGETKVNGVNQNDRQSTTRIQFGGSMFVGSSTQLTATYGRDLSVRNGFKEAHRINLRLLQVF